MHRMPNFAIVGAQRASTTFLHHCLLDHPQIWMPDGEVSFFEAPDPSAEALSAFRSMFAPAAADQVVGIKRPSYLTLEGCAERIHRLAPEIKLIVALRDPVDRAIAAYHHQMLNGFVPCASADRGLRAVLDGAWARRYPRSPDILDFGFYGRHLQRYHELFGPESVLVLAYETVREAPLDAVRRVYEFLGVDAGFVPPSLTQSFQRGIYSLPRLRLQSAASRFRYSYNAERTRLVHKQQTRLDRRVLGLLGWLDRTLFADADERPPVLPTGVRAALQALYEDDVRLLRQLPGVPPLPWRHFGSAELREPNAAAAPGLSRQLLRRTWLGARSRFSPLRLQYLLRRRLGLLHLRRRWRASGILRQ